MAGPISERSIIPVKGGVDDWKEAVKQLLLTLKEQPGFMRTRWGPRSEDMGVLDLLTGWETPEARDAFYASEAHTRAMEAMAPVLNGEIARSSFRFVPHAPKQVIDAPIVQVLTIRGVTDEDAVRAVVEKGYHIPGSRGGASSLSIDGSGIFVCIVGFDSKEVALAADQSAYTPKDADMEVHHVNFLFPIKGFSVTNS